LLVTFGLSFQSCNNVKDENKLIIGIHSWPGNGPLYVGDEMGFFKEAGIEVEFQRIESFDSRRAALASGGIDIDCTTLDQLLILWDNGYEIQLFGISDFSTGGDGIIAKKEIKTLRDLIGKKVAVPEASPSDFFIRYLLDIEGIPIDSIDFRPVADAPTAGTAILAKRYDAAVVFEPWLSESKNDPDLHIIASTTEYPNLIPGIYLARKDDLEKRKELFKKFMQVWYKSVDYFKENPEKSKKIMVRRMEISKDDLDAMLSTITILNKEEIIKEYDINKSPNIFLLTDKISDFWYKSKFISHVYPYDKLINEEIIK